MYRQIVVLVLEIRVAIHNSWSKIVSCVFFLFSTCDMFLLDFNNYPGIFFAGVRCLFLNERSVSFYQKW